MERSTKRNKFFFPFPLEQVRPILLNKERFVLLETRKIDRENYLSYLFFDPVAIITCFNLDRISESLQQLETFLDKGYWAAGFLSYEMGYGLEDFKGKRSFLFPLIRLGIFKQPLIFNHLEGRFLSPLSEYLPRARIAYLINTTSRQSGLMRNYPNISRISSGLKII